MCLHSNSTKNAGLERSGIRTFQWEFLLHVRGDHVKRHPFRVPRSQIAPPLLVFKRNGRCFFRGVGGEGAAGSGSQERTRRAEVGFASRGHGGQLAASWFLCPACSRPAHWLQFLVPHAGAHTLGPTRQCASVSSSPRRGARLPMPSAMLWATRRPHRVLKEFTYFFTSASFSD